MTELEKLERKLSKLYREASRDVTIKWSRYLNGWNEVVDGKAVHHLGLYERYAEQKEALDAGVYTQKEFDEWWLAQEGRGSHWEDMLDQITQRALNVNQTASDYINGALPKVYTKSSNAVASIAKKSAMDKGVTGIRFDLVDEATIRHLVMEKSNNISFKTTSVNPQRDYQWNHDKIQNALTQGILQGESLDKISDRFLGVMGQNKTAAIRNARTAVTSAQNSGRQDRMDDLAEQGCTSMKYWQDVHDSIPPERSWHWEASENYDEAHAIPYDEPFIVDGEELMYPCDPAGSPRNVYNCRCSLGIAGFKFSSVLSREKQKSANIRLKE